MKKLTIILLSLAAYATVVAQPQAIKWQKSLGGTNADVANDIKQTFDGGYVLAGYSQSNNGDVSANHGGKDYWIVKLDSTGAVLWQKNYGGSGDDIAYCIVQTSDSGYVVVGSSASNDGDVIGNHGQNDGWLLKLNKHGILQKEKCFGGINDDIVYSIAPLQSGYILAGGTKSNDGDVSGNHGGFDFWEVALNDTGAIEYSKCFGGSSDDIAYSVSQGPITAPVLCGYTRSNDGDVTGNHGGADMWVLQSGHNMSGTYITWQKCYGGTGDDYGTSSDILPAGYLAVAGCTNSTNGDVIGNHGQNDFWVMQLDPTMGGGIMGRTCLGGSGDDKAYSIHAHINMGSTELLVAGSSTSNDDEVSGNHGGTDYWVVNLAYSLAIKWQKSLGGSQADFANAVAPATDGECVVAGSSASNDDDVSGNHGSTDYWVVKLKQESSTTGIADIENNASFMLFPNPATNEVQLTCSDNIQSVTLTDMSGKEILTQQNNNIGSFTIPTAALTNGVYFIRVTTQSSTATKKILIQH